MDQADLRESHEENYLEQLEKTRKMNQTEIDDFFGRFDSVFGTEVEFFGAFLRIL